MRLGGSRRSRALALATLALSTGLPSSGCRTSSLSAAPGPAANAYRDTGFRPCSGPSVEPEPDWERENPVRLLPTAPLGMEVDLTRSTVRLTPEKVRLGRWLFYDVRLSVDGTVSCATCHQPEHAFADTSPVSKGVGGRVGVRKSPTVINSGFPVTERFFWDGRASSLTEQAKGPITNPVEMANTVEGAVATIAAVPGYRRAFCQVYGDDGVDIDRIADAIAAYETTRLSGGSAWDRFNAGDQAALTDDAQRGMQIFFGRGRCNACHLGPTFSDSRFHNIGVGYQLPANLVQTGFVDHGRYAVTNDPADIGAFKTPPLRDLSKRAPYMHDGSSPDLTDAVFHYIHVERNPWLDPAMDEARVFPFDVPALVAFLESLEGTGFEDSAPRSFPR